MKPKNTTYELEQRVLRLGHQKIEEEALLREVREAIGKPKKDNLSSRRKKKIKCLHFLPAFL
ncbi:MAG: hypothetical protein WBA23_04950 [Tunicatimonas sp.]|uniref:hypothetical protein n=1 Tax=Tunicatimonas sp. TaxID=1940096 RepID=UPI003C739D60